MVVHVKAREREFETCIARVEDYLALFQRQKFEKHLPLQIKFALVLQVPVLFACDKKY